MLPVFEMLFSLIFLRFRKNKQPVDHEGERDVRIIFDYFSKWLSQNSPACVRIHLARIFVFIVDVMSSYQTINLLLIKRMLYSPEVNCPRKHPLVYCFRGQFCAQVMNEKWFPFPAARDSEWKKFMLPTNYLWSPFNEPLWRTFWTRLTFFYMAKCDNNEAFGSILNDWIRET